MKLQITSILIGLCIAGTSLSSYGAPELKSSNDIYSRVSGVWGMETPGLDCKSRPSRYKFGDGNKIMSISNNDQQSMHDGSTRDVVNYKVVSNDKTTITLAMENETRLNKNGKSALWKIVLVSDNKFYWQISGEPQEQWGPVIKCVN